MCNVVVNRKLCNIEERELDRESKDLISYMTRKKQPNHFQYQLDHLQNGMLSICIAFTRGFLCRIIKDCIKVVRQCEASLLVTLHTTTLAKQKQHLTAEHLRGIRLRKMETRTIFNHFNVSSFLAIISLTICVLSIQHNNWHMPSFPSSPLRRGIVLFLSVSQAQGLAVGI